MPPQTFKASWQGFRLQMASTACLGTTTLSCCLVRWSQQLRSWGRKMMLLAHYCPLVPRSQQPDRRRSLTLRQPCKEGARLFILVASFCSAGDEHTWDLADWLWDPSNLSALPKDGPQHDAPCCHTHKRSKTDGEACSHAAALPTREVRDQTWVAACNHACVPS